MAPRIKWLFSFTLLMATWVVSPTWTHADEDTSGVESLVQLLGQIDEANVQLDLLKGMREGLKGRKHVAMPKAWPAVYAKLSKSARVEVRKESTLLALMFGDSQALDVLRRLMMDTKQTVQQRKEALTALLQHKSKDLVPLLHKLVDDAAMCGLALRALGAFDHKETPQVILRHYDKLSDHEKQDAIGTLASRTGYALVLLESVEKKRIPRRDITAFTARQLRNLGNKRVDAQVAKVWGAIRKTSREKKILIAKYKSSLTPKKLKKANLSNGRLLYNQTCFQCHKLFGEGGNLGPDLTGSNRANLDYILENILDPNALVGNDYRLIKVLTVGGRLLSGIIVERSANAVVIQTANEKVTLSTKDIDQMKPSDVSMMPEGQLDKMKPAQIRDLIAYLASRAQVPLPEKKKQK